MADAGSSRGPVSGAAARLRNVFAAVHAGHHYEGLKASLSSPNVIRCNEKYFGVPWTTGGAAGGGGVSGSLAVFPMSTYGKVNGSPYVIIGSKQQLLDFEFYPFERNIVVTASRDPIVKVFKFPRDGVLIEDVVAAEYYLAGHEKKVDIVKFHPFVSDLLLTGSSDQTLRLWDFREMREIQVLEGFEEAPQSVSWSFRGTMIANAARDGTVTLFDPRAKAFPVQTTKTAYAGNKSITVNFTNDASDLLVTGFTKSGDRELSLWDSRNMSAPLSSLSAGDAPGALQPFVDPTIGAVYVASRGEGMKVYEVGADRKLVHVGDAKTEKTQTAVAMLPKKMCDVNRVEIGVFLKLCNENYVQTFSLRVPRKSAPKYFQEDLYPPTPDPIKPTLSAADWDAGKNAAPALIDLRPEDAPSVYDAPKAEGGIARGNAGAGTQASSAAKGHRRGASVSSPAGEGSSSGMRMGDLGYCKVKGSPRHVSYEPRHVSLIGARIHIAADRNAVTSLNIIAVADLESILVLPVADDASQTAFGLSNKHGKHYQFKAESIDDRDAWVRAISIASGIRPTAASSAADAFADLQLKAKAEDLPSIMEGAVEVLGEESWWKAPKWSPRYLVLQDGLLLTFLNEKHAADLTAPPLESMRFITVTSVRMTNLEASYEEKAPAKSTEGLFAFQINTPTQVYFYRVKTEDEALFWVLAIQKVALYALLEHLGRLDDDPAAEDHVLETFSMPVEGYLLRDGAQVYLSVVGGSYYFFKTHLSSSPFSVMPGHKVDAVRQVEKPANSFEVVFATESVTLTARSDQLRQWWIRKLLRAQMLHMDLVERLDLHNVADDKQMRDQLDAQLQQRSVDIGKIKSGEKPALVIISNSRRPAMLVPCSDAFLFKDCAYVLDAGNKVYVLAPPNTPRVNGAKAADLANRIRLKDRGGAAVVVFVNDDGARAAGPFFAAIKGDVKRANAPTESFPIMPSSLDSKQRSVRVFRVIDSRDSRKQVRLMFDSDDTLPSKSLLESQSACVVDAGTELYVWTGQGASSSVKKLASYVATRMAAEHGREPWTTITRILENTETSLFKEKFADYPSSLMIAVAPTDVSTGQYEVVEQPPLDIAAMHAQAMEVPKATYLDDGRGKITVFKIVVRVNKAGGYQYDKEVMPAASHGQFYSGHSFIVVYRYMLKNAERSVIYFWQGHDSSVVEKGASAVETINVSDELGDADQVRVVQGKEPPHFFRIFNNRVVVHAGKMDARRPATRTYQIRDTPEGAVHCTEVGPVALAFNSDHATLVVSGSDVYLWVGKFASETERKAGTAGTLAISAPAGYSARVVNEQEEPSSFLSLFPADAWSARVRPRRRKARVAPSLFLVSGATGVVTVEHIARPTQEDLDNDHVMILDTLSEVYIWIGERATKNEKVLALETAQMYVKESPQGHSPNTLLWVTYPFQEPTAFALQFLEWSTQACPEAKRNLGERCRPLEAVLEQFKTSEYSYAVLTSNKVPEGVDRLRMEEYLSDEEFARVLRMPREAFLKLPAWKQTTLKKEARLF